MHRTAMRASRSTTGRPIIETVVNSTTGKARPIARTRSNKQRQTRSGRLAKMDSIPSLKEFVHKSSVVQQYRDFLQALRLIPEEKDRIPAISEVKQNFRRLSFETNAIAIDMAVKDGEQRLKQVQSLVGYEHHTKKKKKNNANNDNDDSWLNIDDKEDPRGRVGTEWPWDR